MIGGGFFNDGYEALAGCVPGYEMNENAVQALLRKALDWPDRVRSFESKLYQDLYDFERGLGDILIARLPEHEVALLREAGLREIIDAVVLNWSKVADLFDYGDKGEFSRAVSAIPAGARRFISHPIRLNFEPEGLSRTASEQLSSAAKHVRRARDKLR